MTLLLAVVKYRQWLTAFILSVIDFDCFFLKTHTVHMSVNYTQLLISVKSLKLQLCICIWQQALALYLVSIYKTENVCLFFVPYAQS